MLKSISRNRWEREVGFCTGYDSTVALDFTHVPRYRNYRKPEGGKKYPQNILKEGH